MNPLFLTAFPMVPGPAQPSVPIGSIDSFIEVIGHFHDVAMVLFLHLNYVFISGLICVQSKVLLVKIMV